MAENNHKLLMQKIYKECGIEQPEFKSVKDTSDGRYKKIKRTRQIVIAFHIY